MANSNTSEQDDVGRVEVAEEARVEDADSAIASSDIGTLLCATRMRMGKNLQIVAEVLHIRYSFLVAIEDGRYEDLPGQAYAVGFVRSYADHLGLDGTEVVRRYKEESAGVKRKASFEFPIPTPDSGVPSGALLLLAVVFGMIVYGSWYSIAGSDRSAVQLIQEVPSRLTALLENETEDLLTEGGGVEGAAPINQMPSADEIVEEPETQAVVSAPSTTSTNTQPSTGEDDVGPAEANSSELSADSTVLSPTNSTAASVEPISNVDAPVPSASAEADDEPGRAADEASQPNSSDAEPQQTAGIEEVRPKGVVELRAKTDSWIQLREGEELLLTRLLRKGEIFQVPERAGLTLMTGNAGGLEVLVNGEVLPPLGLEGTVARGVSLDPQQLLGRDG